MELDSLFTVTSLLSLQGSAAAAVLVPNVVGVLVGHTFDPFRKWTSLGVALALAYLTAALAQDGPTRWIVAFFNGLLIFASAMGINQLPKHNRPKTDDKSGEQVLTKLQKFFKSWV
ncbi:MAG TPA: hypothetical protein VE172_24745 [Stackebrandtia sp.]|jgi:hypothetical protein|uniref:hypothetical protein n=1 Tax=Stackebrandtia sp. TaxID=2023065 RepID=UPI002D2BFAC5|nr:hypothetical protein [Stackebrandtia sp.]HZE42017.1 hypothetical protein [Stackebrandtia sp.]